MSDVRNPPSRSQHVMLLYDINSNRDLAAINYINQGLTEKQLCIYASVNAYDPSHLSMISSRIKNYEENIGKRNLFIVNLKPFYDSVLAGDLTPFEEFKVQLQKELKDRDVMIVGDCADNLFRNKHFDQCELVEKWWQENYIEWRRLGQNHITIICPHSGSLLSKDPFEHHKHQISHNHTVAIDITGRRVKGYIMAKEVAESDIYPREIPIQILVAEPERDLQQIYNIWLRSMGFKNITITESARKCLDELLKIIDANKNKTNGFDMVVILDTHLKDIPCIQVAKEIVNKRPNQRIIFTTTLPPDNFRQDLYSNGIKNNNEILLKPFRFSKLLSLIGMSIGSQQDRF
ncbi:MAG TPA: response regulator [Candidatus Nitrosopolaris sp.]|nr:response regulator [Candidatus Nitrosopolaris sp.]